MSDEPDIVAAIAHEIEIALERLDVPFGLLAIVSSWRDTQDDAATLDQIRAYNEAVRRERGEPATAADTRPVLTLDQLKERVKASNG